MNHRTFQDRLQAARSKLCGLRDLHAFQYDEGDKRQQLEDLIADLQDVADRWTRRLDAQAARYRSSRNDPGMGLHEAVKPHQLPPGAAGTLPSTTT